MRFKRCLFVSAVSFALTLSLVVVGKATDDDIVYSESDSAAYLSVSRVSQTPRKGLASEVFSYPGNITVINKEEIRSFAETTPGASVADILRYTQGLIVRDYIGQGKTVSVDMRGFGETAQQNVAVLINGRRADNIDMATVDWTQIPVGSVEKIEILRGPSAVLYGDNATGGVINIITSPLAIRETVKPSGGFLISGGSYNSGKLNLNLKGNTTLNRYIIYNLTASRNFTDGARENSAAANTDINGTIGYISHRDNSRKFSVDFGYHNDRYGMPGALSETDWNSNNLTKAQNPSDESKTSDGYIQLIAALPPITDGKISHELSASYRNRLSDSYWRDWFMGEERNSYLSGAGYKLIYNDDNLGSIVGGMEGNYGLQKIKTLDANDNPVPGSDTDLKKNSLAFYLSNDIKFAGKKFYLSAGARYEIFDYSFLSAGANEIKISSGVASYSLGASYLPDNRTSLYIKFGSSARMPKVDEYYAWGLLNSSLLIQMTESLEGGARLIFSKKLAGNINLFRMDSKNEIYYNPATYSNENYEKTSRTGAEAGLNFKPASSLTLNLSYTYTDAKITEGIYKGSVVPSVPSHSGSITGILSLVKNLDINLNGNYIGERYFISDQKNISPRLNAYTVFNTNLSYKIKSVRIFGGINNILDEKYAEYGVYAERDFMGNFVDRRSYYPSPRRNFFIGTEITF